MISLQVSYYVKPSTGMIWTLWCSDFVFYSTVLFQRLLMKHLYPDENGLFYDDNVLNRRRRVLSKWFDEDENKLSFYHELPSRSKFYQSYCFYRL